MRKRLIAGCALAIATVALAAGEASGQGPRFVPDVKTFTEADCDWYHSQVIGSCAMMDTCSAEHPTWGLSLGISRGLTAREGVVTLRAQQAIDSACQAACKTKRLPIYSDFKKAACDQLLKR